ncbi:hypothetical protein [Streptomyces sp. NPDC020742]|uniref:hypothetical protein n=1 Tax=unclassified Streptomyces TaxID=2593676 RepID=UPI0033FA9E06
MITGNETPLPGWRGGDGNAAYLDKTLRHQPIEMALNESVSGKTIFRLWLRAALASFLASLIPGFIGFISLLSGLGSQSDSYGSGSFGSDSYGSDSSGDGSAGFGWLVFASATSFVVFWVVLLMSRLPEPVGEWRVLLADRPDRAGAVYATITGTLGSRRYPLVPQGMGTRVALSDGPYTAYVSVFNYGTSLYLGWMMWRSRRGTELMGQFIGDFVRGLKGENGIEHQLLRSEGARAMREAVHLACREGLMVAVDGTPVHTAPAAPPQAGATPPPPAVPPTVPPSPTAVPPQPGQQPTAHPGGAESTA